MEQSKIKWLWKVTGKRKYYVALLMLFQALNGGSGVLYALLLRNIVDSAANGENSLFWKYCTWCVLLVIGQILIRAVIRFLGEFSRSSLENRFKNRLFDNILHKDFASVSAVHSGEWNNRMTNDCKIVADNFTEILPGISGMIVKLVSAGIMMIVLQPKFAVLLIVAGIVLLFLTYSFRKILKRLHKQIQEKDGKLRIFLQERIGSLMMIHSFVAEEQSEIDAANKMKEHKSARMVKNHVSNVCNVGFQAGIMGMYLLGVFYCGYGILMGTISYGTLTAITQLISQIQSPFANISGYLPKFYEMIASAERLMEIESFKDDTNVASLDIKEVSEFYNKELNTFGLKNAQYTYFQIIENIKDLSKTDMPMAINDINIEIKKGEYIAFTGHSGCGKSTVLKLLMSIYKLDGGKCFLTDKTGNELPLTAEWRRLFAYVPQGNQLMSGTIREIVSFADKTAINDDKRIITALKISCADEFVNNLENGIDTLLGERGEGLSEGQMQRIAIARAIFSDSPVLLLDESTSALDEKTEKQVLQNLRQMTNKTVVIVTHRKAALKICDRILEFTENGVIEKDETRRI